MACQLEKLCIDAKLKKQKLQDEDKKSALNLNDVLNFVESKNHTQSREMKTAYKFAKDSGMNPVWITVDQALNLCKENKNHAFIIDSFKTDLFDKLHQNSNCQIFGPACVYYCKNGLHLPRRQLPILNLCMRNLVICVDDQFDQNEAIRMFGLVNLMGGTFTFQFKPLTTHLISDDFTTEKSRIARTYGIPIMNKDWIYKCWEMSLINELNADDRKIINKFKLPTFKGFRINISQIFEEKKAKLQSLILKNGGQNVEFRPAIVTHLILGQAQGEKYDCAKKVGMRIMTQNWIIESVQNGYPMIEYEYLFEPSNTQPRKFDFFAHDAILNNNNNISSSQKNEPTKFRSSQIYSAAPNSQIVSPDNLQAINSSQIITPQTESSQEFTQKGCLKPQAPEPGKTFCVKSKAELAQSNSLENKTKKTAFSVLTSSQSSTNKHKPVNVEEELEKLANKLINCKSGIFDGCDFYINDNFQQNIKNLVKRCISLQNGTISANLRQSVSHVIVKEESSEAERTKLSKELDKFDHTINQVTLNWIIQCSKSNKLIPLLKINNQIKSPMKKEQLSFSQNSIYQRQASQFQRRSKLSRNNSFQSQPACKPLPIREIEPLRTDDIFQDYSDINNLQSNVIDNSKTVRTEFDLDLMRKEEKPLYKCVLTISSYPVSLKTELTKIAERLGASCQSDFVKYQRGQEFKPKNTHLVCDEAVGKKYEKSLQWGIPAVNQNWLRKCLELVQRVNEKDYPPKKIDCDQLKSNSQIFSATSGSIISPPDESSNDKKSDSNQQSDLFAGKQNNSNDKNSQSSSQIFQTNFENLKAILNKQTTKSTRLPLTIVDDRLDSDKSADIKIDILNDDGSCFQNVPMPSIPIAWDDCNGTHKKSTENTSYSLPTNLTNQTRVTTCETLNITPANQTQDSIIRSKLIEKPKESFQVFQDTSSVIPQPESECKFSFIGYTPEEKQKYSIELAKLNIKVMMDESLECDYVITQSTSLTRNEIFFVSIAQGKWILHPDFCTKTIELGKVPNPEDYEWGGASRYLTTLNSKFAQLAKACKYWRIKVAQTKKRAFSGKNIMIVSINAKSYANIINNGGGKASAAELKSDSVESYTDVLIGLQRKLKEGQIKHLDCILINYKKSERDKLNLLNLIKPIEAMKIPCLQIDYLSLFLVSDQKLSLKSVLINPTSPNSNTLKRGFNADYEQRANPNKIAKR